jgi:hypothetical protein
MNIVIYKQDNNQIAVMIPTEEALQKYTIMQIAERDVPPGKPFKIVDSSELPKDVPQEFWEIDDEDLDNGVGNENNEFN